MSDRTDKYCELCCNKRYYFQMWEDRDGRKQMSKPNSKGLTTLRQKLRKYNRDFEDNIKSYREVRFVDYCPSMLLILEHQKELSFLAIFLSVFVGGEWGIGLLTYLNISQVSWSHVSFEFELFHLFFNSHIWLVNHILSTYLFEVYMAFNHLYYDIEG